MTVHLAPAIADAGIVYHGPSLLAPEASIVAILTSGSRNTKTGDMAQVWILAADKFPRDAATLGEDDSVCGDCRWRGDGTGAGRTCYVNLAHAPTNVFRAYQAGRYHPRDTPLGRQLLGKGKHLRLGAYGDPAAVPIDIWEDLLADAAGWTGYTHQWHTCSPWYKTFLMASVDSEIERVEATTRGWRTFRSISKFDPEVRVDEILCPASAEMDHQATCVACELCSGTQRPARSIAIHAHGAFVPLYRRGQVTFPELTVLA